MAVADSYVKRLKEGKSPEKEIVECLLEDLNQEYSSRGHDAVNYTISSRKLQRDLEERTLRRVSSVTIGRTIRALLTCSELKEGKDYRVIKGTPRKYLLEKLDKSKVEEMNKFRAVAILL